LTQEPQRPAVLGHDSDDVVRHASRHLGLYLEHDLHVCSDQACQVGDHLLGDSAGVAADAGGV
jgi:hypothetical protein